MLKVNERTFADNPSLLAQWADRVIGLAGMRVKVRLRGNKLHILCEGRECPDKQTVLNRLTQALNVTKLSELLPADQPPPKQLFLYGRASGKKRPAWTELIDLKQLEQLQLRQRRQAEAARRSKERGVRGEGDRSNSKSGYLYPLTAEAGKSEPSLKELARTGHPSAIARYLGETLKPLGVKVKVVAKVLPHSPDSRNGGSSGKEPSRMANRRLWVACESAYSPDPSLLAAPVAQQLRELHLKGFQDAVILSQVTGEATPDWMLRVDLTPPEEMLQEWCRWGDPEAIARLLNQALAPQGVEVSAVLKDLTLHISCIAAHGQRQDSRTLPDKSACIREIALILLSLAPQGIHAATIYGHETAAAPPVWVDWLNLPAGKSPALAKSALDLAREWDEAAIAFLLGRFLNPDLDWRLATGGIRIQVRFKEDLLHIMSDAPVCPSQRLVAAPSIQFVRQLDIPELAGVRVYGRRAGQKQPLWSYGVDLIARTRQEPEATPEFPKSEAFADDDLLTEEPDEPIRPPALHPGDFKTAGQQRVQEIVQFLVRQLVRSQLFVERDETRNVDPSLPEQASAKGAPVVLVWAAVGLLLTVSVDLVVGQLLDGKVNSRRAASTSEILPSEPPVGQIAALDGNSELPETNNLQGVDDTAPLSNLSRSPSRTPKEAAVFNASGFTQQGEPTLEESLAISTESSPYPSFNNPQLDRKLLLYRQRLDAKGSPDVLIIGSSRALRGIDPAALQQALAAQGYGKTEIFNFGINGATAQVVDLLLRRILTPEQLPKLIIWADGARAFNSGRTDNTFQSIQASVGYQKLVAGALQRANSLDEKPFNSLEPFTVTPIVPGTASNVWAVGSRNLNEWLNQFLVTVSATYPQRDRLQTALRDQFTHTFNPRQEPEKATQKLAAERLKNWNGFFPVSIRFNPTTYYRKHSRVAGEYDSDYRNFKLGGSQAIALRSLIQFTQANQVPLVFVNLPLTQEYLDPVRRQYEQEFELSMVRLALGQEFIFRNWSELWPTKNEYFSDPSHLNRYGAAAVALRLAQDPLIPWPKSKK